MTLAYVYKWTELATGKWYVGARGARGCHPDDGYICSSKVVKPLILANPDGWKREILFTSVLNRLYSYCTTRQQSIINDHDHAQLDHSRPLFCISGTHRTFGNAHCTSGEGPITTRDQRTRISSLRALHGGDNIDSDDFPRQGADYRCLDERG